MIYKLSRLGIGDIFLFCLEQKQNDPASLSINIDLSKIKTYRNESSGYLEFVKEILVKFLPNTQINFIENKYDILYTENWKKIYKSITTQNIIEFYQKLFKYEKEKDYYVLFTKIRDVDYHDYLSLQKNFYKILNEKNTKIILLGEREIEYGVEYQILGPKKVYSIYNDILSNVNSELIIDKTIPKLGVTVPNTEQIFEDMKIIVNSKKTIMIGRGGFFCLSLITKKLLSYQGNTFDIRFPNLLNQELFTDQINFLNKITND